MGWIDEVRDRASVKDAANNIGLKLGRQGSAGPCPACNAERRGSEDPRLPIGMRGDGKGWNCFACDNGGDAAELAVLGWFGRRMRELSKEERQSAHERAAGLGWCEPPGSGSSTPRAARRARPGADTAQGGGGRRRPAREPAKRWGVDKAVKGKPAAPPQPPDPAKSRGPMGWRPELPQECVEALRSPDGAPVLDYLKGRGFGDAAMKFWELGALLVRDRDGKVVEQYVAIPMKRRDGEIINMRFRSIPGTCLRCGGAGCPPPPKGRRPKCRKGQVIKSYGWCPGGEPTLFGVHTLDPDESSTVIIAEGELDVIALWEYGIRVNVVTGSAGSKTWKEEWLDELEPYKHFALLYDDDDAGNAGIEKVSKALGVTRCSRVLLPDDPAGCLENDVPPERIHAAIDAAAPLFDVRLAKVTHYHDEIEALIEEPDKLRGLTTGSAKLDKGIGGLRPGLVIVTGDTAAGKTTFTHWLGGEQAARGVPTMFSSFEQTPIGSVQKLLRAELGGDFTHVSRESRKRAMDRLGRKPIFMLDHYGELSADDCLDSIDYAVRRLGVRLAIVDHLGFLVRDAKDERQAIEKVVRDYALFGVHNEVCIMMIAHPNNLSVVQQRRVKLSDLKGASAIRQDAHVGLVVERLMPTKDRPYPASAVHVDKCRAEFGSMGARLVLPFDPDACVYADRWADTPMGARGEDADVEIKTKRRRPGA